MNETESQSLQRKVGSLEQEVNSLRHTLQELLARNEQARALVWPQHFEGEPGEERMGRIEQEMATLGQRREAYKPVLLSGGPSVSYFLAKITGAGPYSEDDYEDERYWVIEQRVANTTGDSTTDLTFENKPNGLHVTATNLTEAIAETHDLPLNAGVVVFSSRGQEAGSQAGQTQPVIHYWFGLEPLADPTDPEQINPEPEGTETADTDTWDRDAPAEGKDGVKIKVHMRSTYNHAGDEKLYGFWRELTIDRFGRLTDITGETRYTIDTPVECP